jgi:hypothetical protein
MKNIKRLIVRLIGRKKKEQKKVFVNEMFANHLNLTIYDSATSCPLDDYRIIPAHLMDSGAESFINVQQLICCKF